MVVMWLPVAPSSSLSDFRHTVSLRSPGGEKTLATLSAPSHAVGFLSLPLKSVHGVSVWVYVRDCLCVCVRVGMLELNM